MLKNLIRLTVAMICGSLILMNLSLAYSSGSVRAEESRGKVYTASNGNMVVICPGEDEPGCPPIQDQQ
jgi:hypothetical protein